MSTLPPSAPIISAPTTFKHAVKVTFNQEFSRYDFFQSIFSLLFFWLCFRFEGLPPEWKHQNQQFGVPIEVNFSSLVVLYFQFIFVCFIVWMTVTSKENGEWILLWVSSFFVLFCCFLVVIWLNLRQNSNCVSDVKETFIWKQWTFGLLFSDSLWLFFDSHLIWFDWLIVRWLEYFVWHLIKMLVWLVILIFSTLQFISSHVVSFHQVTKNQINHGEYEGCSDVNILANLIKVELIDSLSFLFWSLQIFGSLQVFFRELPTNIFNTLTDESIHKYARMPIAETINDMDTLLEGKNGVIIYWLLDLMVSSLLWNLYSIFLLILFHQL